MRLGLYTREIHARRINLSILPLFPLVRRAHGLATREKPTQTALQLRDYQEHCIDACMSALSRGVTRIGVSMPTGSGKTTVFVSLLHKVMAAKERPHAKRSLIIVNSIELALQAANQVKRMFPDTTVEIEQGKNSASGLADITVATYQTLARGGRLEKFDPRWTKAVIVDEAHHAAAKSYLSILSHFDPVVGIKDAPPEQSTLVPIIGFSATFGRHDGQALGAVFQEIVYHKDFLQMIKDQWLCNVRFTIVKANIDLSAVTVNRASGDFAASSLAQVMNTEAINSLVVQSWIEKAGNRKSTLVFCTNTAHVHDLTNEFRKRGVDARYIHAGTPAKERLALLDGFRSGLFPVLVNCAILTEGADVPNIDCVVIARPTRSRNIFAQMIGRGMRLSPGTGKEDCHILDFVDTHDRVAGTFSTPTLFGLHPSDIESGATLEELMAKKEAAQEDDKERPARETEEPMDSPRIKSVTYVEHEDPFSWEYDSKREKHIHSLSALSWVPIQGSYILECMGKGSMRIQPFEDANGKRIWEVNFIAAWDKESMKQLFGRPGGIAGRTRRIATAGTLPDAVSAAESFAKQKLAPGQLGLGLLRTAKWRQGPSTLPQRQILAKSLGISLDPKSKEVDPAKAHMRAFSRVHSKEDLARLTKGRAADMITKLRSGVKGAYDKELKRRAREAKEQQKEDSRRARETVRVGPLST